MLLCVLWLLAVITESDLIGNFFVEFTGVSLVMLGLKHVAETNALPASYEIKSFRLNSRWGARPLA